MDRGLSLGARITAIAVIVISGMAGAVIGQALASVSCDGACGAWKAGGTFAGALATAAGVAVVTALALRASTEWRR